MRTSFNNPRHGRARPPLRVWLGAIALGVCLLTAWIWRDALSSLIWRVATPIVELRNALGQSDAATLRAQLASTTALVADRDLLYQENLDLKARLGRDLGSTSRVLAAVLQSPPAAAYDTLIIDAGAGSGIAIGDKVSAGGSTVIGEISAVYATTARVTLYSAPGTSYQAQLVGANGNVPISVEGQGAGSFEAQVPVGTEVAVDEPVVFAGSADALVAKVAAVIARPGESFIHVYLHMPVDLFELRFVEVITH